MLIHMGKKERAWQDDSRTFDSKVFCRIVWFFLLVDGIIGVDRTARIAGGKFALMLFDIADRVTKRLENQSSIEYIKFNMTVQISQSSAEVEALEVGTDSLAGTAHSANPIDFFLKKGSWEGWRLTYKETRRIGI